MPSKMRLNHAVLLEYPLWSRSLAQIGPDSWLISGVHYTERRELAGRPTPWFPPLSLRNLAVVRETGRLHCASVFCLLNRDLGRPIEAWPAVGVGPSEETGPCGWVAFLGWQWSASRSGTTASTDVCMHGRRRRELLDIKTDVFVQPTAFDLAFITFTFISISNHSFPVLDTFVRS